ncbi:MAG: hypothetical protein IT423_00605 [Pirellulaceae bacterium]|nr:hypothetical protein [Pirellulaceae bacterium]
MSNDLEKFLQQAAERLAQKTSGRSPNRGSGRPSEPPSSGGRSRQRQPPVAEIISAEVVDDGARQSSLREAGPDPLSTIDTRPGLAQAISQTDERMVDHMHKTFDHELMHLKAASSTLRAQTPAQAQAISDDNLSRATMTPLMAMLRDPATIRAAFIASEIFKRRG